MLSVQTEGSTHFQRKRISPACLVLSDTFASGFFHRFDLQTSIFLSPLAPPPLRGFSATMETLTPNRVSPSVRSPYFTHTSLTTIPSPTTRWSPMVALARYPSAPQVPLFRGSRLRHWLAGSPIPSGRIEFVILRTGRSPPVAFHPASRRRSYSRLQAGERLPGEDFHLSECVRS